MSWVKTLSEVVIIAINVSFSCLLWTGFSKAQTVIDGGIVLPSADEDHREERLIDGMNRGMKQDYRGAIAIFSELIQRYPDYAEAYFNRGIARDKLQDYQGAIADQTKAIDLNPQLAEAYQARAKLYWQLGDRRSAKKDLQTAITLFELQQNVVSQHQAEQLIDQWQAP